MLDMFDFPEHVALAPWKESFTRHHAAIDVEGASGFEHGSVTSPEIASKRIRFLKHQWPLFLGVVVFRGFLRTPVFLSSRA